MEYKVKLLLAVEKCDPFFNAVPLTLSAHNLTNLTSAPLPAHISCVLIGALLGVFTCQWPAAPHQPQRPQWAQLTQVLHMCFITT